jgi:hypothetical protein
VTVDAGDAFAQMLRGLWRDPQQVARQVAAAGEKVIGYLGSEVPVALILAAGALPVRVRSGALGSTDHADRYIESSFAPEARAIADAWLRGGLNHLHSVVFARGDDSGQRLYYYLCEMQRRGLCGGPRPLLYDVAGLPRDASLEHTLGSTRWLASQLGASPTKLAQAVDRVRQRESLVRVIRAQRLEADALPGSSAWACEFALACDWRSGIDDATRRWLVSAQTLRAPRRVVLAGNSPRDDHLHRAVEAAGGSLVLDLTESAGDEAPLSDALDPLAGIAARVHRRESPVLSMRRDAGWLAARATEQGAHAVILWLSEQDEALPWEAVRQSQALRAAGIPLLMLARQPWQVPAEVLAQVQDFVKSTGAPR